MSLPTCCQTAMEDGEYPEHLKVCVHRPPEPPAEPETPALFDMPDPKTEEGGPLL
ncbi:hypothetical protein [Nonomuraea sp. NPDC050202]|uniref:hypothetical protein n=1 Tax=Nonomuraea sp. NPDC050202 TaxID=3155035 RepID=UPI0033C3508E